MRSRTLPLAALLALAAPAVAQDAATESPAGTWRIAADIDNGNQGPFN